MSAIVNLKGRKPQALLPGEVYCGRSIRMGGWNLEGSKWANPYRVGRDCDTPEQCLALYWQYVLSRPDLISDLSELRGKVLACWCVPARCHCEVIMALLK